MFLKINLKFYFFLFIFLRWAASKKLLGRPDLLSSIKEFDMDTLEENTVLKIGKYFEEKAHLTEESVAGASKAASALLKWVKAAHSFYFVNKKVKPKKAKLAIAQAEAD
jgi:dynein heavy chain, axonemal